MQLRFQMKALLRAAYVLCAPLAAILISALPADATQYYVATTGSNSNPGTQASPFLTLQKGASVVAAGDTVHVANGTYNTANSCNAPSVSVDATVCQLTSGTAALPITFVSDTKWGAKITCPSDMAIFVVEASYIVFNGFDITCPMSTKGFVGGIYGNNGHNTFKNNYVHDFSSTSGTCPATGIFFGSNSNSLSNTNAGYNLWDSNIIHHITQTTAGSPTCPNHQGIYLTAPYEVAVNNIVSGGIGWGIHAYGSGICHQTISNNTVFDNSQGGIVVKNVGNTGGYVDYCANGAKADFMTITNNTVVNNGYGQNFTGGSYSGEGGGIYFTTFSSSVGPNNLISNNLVYGNNTFQVTVLAPATAVGTVSGTDGTVFIGYQADKNWAPAAGYTIANYAEKTGSPSIDGGISTGAPSADILGAVRPGGSGYDIGAFERAGCGM